MYCSCQPEDCGVLTPGVFKVAAERPDCSLMEQGQGQGRSLWISVTGSACRKDPHWTPWRL